MITLKIIIIVCVWALLSCLVSPLLGFFIRGRSVRESAAEVHDLNEYRKARSSRNN